MEKEFAEDKKERKKECILGQGEESWIERTEQGGGSFHQLRHFMQQVRAGVGGYGAPHLPRSFLGSCPDCCFSLLHREYDPLFSYDPPTLPGISDTRQDQE